MYLIHKFIAPPLWKLFFCWKYTTWIWRSRASFEREANAQCCRICSRRPAGDAGLVRLLHFARTPQCPTRFCSGVLAVFDDLHTVHEHMFHTGRVLMRFFKGGVIRDRRRIEHHYVGEHSFLEKSAVIEPEICRR